MLLDSGTMDTFFGLRPIVACTAGAVGLPVAFGIAKDLTRP